MNMIAIAIILAVIFCVGWIMLELFTSPTYRDGECPDVRLPACCEEVCVSHIEPPHQIGITTGNLKRKYLAAQAAMTKAHPSMESRIRRQMAECLIQGWPIDVAIAQAAYSFTAGACRCDTCQNLINSDP